jgi:hypothetical protein
MKKTLWNLFLLDQNPGLKRIRHKGVIDITNRLNDYILYLEFVLNCTK